MEYALWDDGFLPDPESLDARIFNPNVVTFDEVGSASFVGALGPPGIGKSTALEDERTALITALSKGGEKLLAVDLRDCPDAATFNALTFSNAVYEEWLSGDHTLHLYIDSIDEGMLQVPTIARFIANGLKRAVPHSARLKVRVGCRSAEWPATLDDVAREVWPSDQVSLYRLVPLRRRDVEEAARGYRIDPAAFVDAVMSNDVVPLAIVPVTLTMLLDYYAKHHTLPGHQGQIYEAGCRLLCAETSDSRLEVGHDVDADRRYAVAMRIAAGTVFCNRTGVDVGRDTVNALITDVPAAVLADGHENVRGNAVDVTESAVRDALASGLFERRGDRSRVFGHRTYAEFMAAAYVAERKMPLSQVREIIFGADGRVVPQLYETAAWLAAMVPPLVDEITLADPRVLLQSSVALSEPIGREKVVDSLLRQFGRGEGGDFDGSLTGLLARLNHPKLADQLLPYITGKSEGKSARQTAIDLARECEVSRTADLLAAIALDKSEDPSLRARAARAYSVLQPHDGLNKLGPLASLPEEEDPDDDLKAASLMSRWPGRMTAAELFAALTQPRKNIIRGRYWTFLHSKFADDLRREDLPVALAWVRDTPTLKADAQQLAHSAAAILERAWRDASVPMVMNAFAEAALAVLTRHEPLARPIKSTRYERLIAADDPNRLPLAEQLVPFIIKSAVSPARIVNGQTPILLARDIPWMLEKLRGAAPPEQEVWAQLIRGVFSIHDPKNTEYMSAILPVADTCAVLKEQFTYLIDPVKLDSEEAKLQRELFEEERERERREAEDHPPLDPPPSARIENALIRSESRDATAWLEVAKNVELTTGEKGRPVYIDRIAVRESPGWKSADEPTRARIVAAARRYLEFDHPKAEEWLEKPDLTVGLTGACRGCSSG